MVGQNIILREILRNDLPKINAWRNDKDVVDQLGASYRHIGIEVDNSWFDYYVNNRDKAVRLAILEKALNSHIGNIYLTNIDPTNRSAEYSIMIGEKEFWGKGFGAEATEMILRHGHNDLNLHRIYLTVLESNVRAQKMYEKVGFKIEGVLRDSIFKNGAYQNQVIMSHLGKQK